MIHTARRSIAATLFCCTGILLGCTTAASVKADRPRLSPAVDSIVDPKALNFEKGRWGTCINGQTFQQEAVVSFKGYQYATFFADGGALAVARRKLPDGAWQVIRFSDYTLKKPYHNDVHNVAVIGVCEADGTIHLSFDHHVHPLRYRKSIAGLAATPDKFEWKQEHFGAITSELEAGKPIKGVSYPQFFSAPGGKLQLLYRTGGSGGGDWHLAEYDGGKGAWSAVGMLFSQAGDYQGSNSRCAYPHPLRYDAAGRLHVSWCWREDPALETNHDLCYAWSDDAGRTWRNNAGDLIAKLGGDDARPIGINSPGIVVQPIPLGWGVMNTTTMFVDGKRRVHVVNWQQPLDADGPSKDLRTWKYVHYWRGDDGVWKNSVLPTAGRKPQIVVDNEGNAYVIFRKAVNANYHVDDSGGVLTVVAATGWTDWKTVWESKERFTGEPLTDPHRWANEGVLSIYAQREPPSPGAASALHVIDFSLGK